MCVVVSVSSMHICKRDIVICKHYVYLCMGVDLDIGCVCVVSGCVQRIYSDMTSKAANIMCR